MQGLSTAVLADGSHELGLISVDCKENSASGDQWAMAL